LVAGVLALVLSVRPDLSWRDVQHLCVQSATPFSLDDPDWADLPSGRKFNHKFGYGVVDAYKIVEMAKDFKRVGDQVSLDIESPTDLSDLIPDITPAMINKDQAYTNTLNVTEQHMEDAQLSRVEHVTVTVNIQHERRGDLEIYLQSPNGVVSQLATARINDESTEGFDNWTFMTVKHW
jgi:kexin